ncbi:MAG: SlyX family protein [Candidatus Omnitrophica bacterium]|nr:SlyX family protein [Candidatus Omnitrophota bacterium]
MVIYVSMEQRLTELEHKISHQDKLLQELNEVIFAMSKRIEQLESRQKAMNDQFASGNLVKRQEDEAPPPHY